MKYKPINRVKVSLEIEGASSLIGELAWSQDERRAYFEYTADYLRSPHTLSPFHLPTAPGVHPARHAPFEGLHGLFNDSLPDGWGRLLLDRRLQKHGVDYNLLTPLDRLAAVGGAGMGALSFAPVLPKAGGLDPQAGLDWFADQISNIQSGLSIQQIDMLQSAQGSSAGARPKIMIGLSPDHQHLVIDYGQTLPDGYEHWMVKFPSRQDPSDIGAEEKAYALMAGSAGIDMSQTRLLKTEKGNRFFATRRFDRSRKGRVHIHTIGGLLYADHRTPSLDYKDILKVTHLMTRDQSEVLRMFRRMVFNVFAYNRDDHVKNHSLLMNAAGVWTLTPAYDLTFSSGPGGEHCTTIANEGRAPQRKHMLQIAQEAAIAKQDANDEIDRVISAVADWKIFADEVELSKARQSELESVFAGVLKQARG